MDRFHSLFLGPKAENVENLQRMVVNAIADYAHWRKNYFPEDQTLYKQRHVRQGSETGDQLDDIHQSLLAKLRRNFPFYSPRYLGHMLSDTQISGVVGYISGMLYNPNNVTPEAAPITTVLEVEACNNILEMIGYTIPPVPPNKEDLDIGMWKKYQQKLAAEFGWSHITSGGTVANIEALWAARVIKYFPLSVKELCSRQNIIMSIKLSNGKVCSDIRTVENYNLINIRSNESMYLLGRLIRAWSDQKNIEISNANIEVQEELRNCELSVQNDWGHLYSLHKPVILCSGAAHYCIEKAADLLGIGRNSVRTVEVTESYRMDMDNLRKQIAKIIENNEALVAVVGVWGTTEEGAIDPIHRICDLRSELEEQFSFSFWLHVDAAWGGMCASIFRLNRFEYLSELYMQLVKGVTKASPRSMVSAIEYLLGRIEQWFAESMKSRVHQYFSSEDFSLKHPGWNLSSIKDKYPDSRSESEEDVETFIIEGKQFYGRLRRKSEEFIEAVSSQNYRLSWELLTYIINLLHQKELLDEQPTYFQKLTPAHLSSITAEEVHYTGKLKFGNFEKKLKIGWGKVDTINSYLAWRKCESITIDPHKMGFIQYPCGVISFRNDRVRHFISNAAPYITSATRSALVHQPPRHASGVSESNGQINTTGYKVKMEAYAPFILEGSRPGASACSLWMATQALPLTRRHHGELIKNSILCTNILYHSLINWFQIRHDNNMSDIYDLLPLVSHAPDTNVVNFIVVPKRKMIRLEDVNRLTEAVYAAFSINTELGDDRTSYSQPFFISKTPLSSPKYSLRTVTPLIQRINGIDAEQASNAYLSSGEFSGYIQTLRMTIMNPYLSAFKEELQDDYIGKFMTQLHEVSVKMAKALIS